MRSRVVWMAGSRRGFRPSPNGQSAAVQWRTSVLSAVSRWRPTCQAACGRSAALGLAEGAAMTGTTASLAERFQRATEDVVAFVGGVSDAQWRAVNAAEGRSI